MAKFRKNQKVYIPKLGKVGTVKRVNYDGQPIEVEVDGQIINTVGLVFEVLTVLKKLWLALKILFGKSK